MIAAKWEKEFSKDSPGWVKELELGGRHRDMKCTFCLVESHSKRNRNEKRERERESKWQAKRETDRYTKKMIGEKD